MNKIKKLALIAGCAIVVIALAYVLGTEAGHYISEQNRDENMAELRAKGVERTAALLGRMGTIQIGDTLANFILEDIDGNVIQLSEIVTEQTLIAYIKPDCDACLIELDGIAAAIKQDSDSRHFILISSANPMHMQKLRTNFGLNYRMLYDEERSIGARLNIESFPFSIVINRSREILEIYGTAALPEVFENIINANN